MTRLKMRGGLLFLSREFWAATVGLLTDLISMLLCLRTQGSPTRGKDEGTAGWWSGQNTLNIYGLGLPSYMGVFVAPKTMKKVTSKITDHLNKYNHAKVWNIARITKMWPTDFVSAQHPESHARHRVATNLQFVKRVVCGKGNTMKLNKLRTTVNRLTVYIPLSR